MDFASASAWLRAETFWGMPAAGVLVALAAAAGTEVAKATGFVPLEKLCKPLIVPAALTIALREGARGGAGAGNGGLGPVEDGFWVWIGGLGTLILFAVWIASKGARAK